MKHFLLSGVKPDLTFFQKFATYREKHQKKQDARKYVTIEHHVGEYVHGLPDSVKLNV